MNRFTESILGHVVIGCINAIFIKQCLMCSAFGNAVFSEDNDFICIFNSGQTVSDGERCTVSGEFLPTVLDPSLTFVVQGNGCLIKNKNRRILQEDPGNGNTLLLAAGKSGTAFTDKGIILIGQFHDEVMDIGTFGSCNNFIF